MTPTVTGILAPTSPLQSANERDKMTVSCDDCNTPLFAVTGGMLVFKVRHHGEVHTTLVSIAELYQKYVAMNPLPNAGVMQVQPLDFLGVGQ